MLRPKANTKDTGQSGRNNTSKSNNKEGSSYPIMKSVPSLTPLVTERDSKRKDSHQDLEKQPAPETDGLPSKALTEVYDVYEEYDTDSGLSSGPQTMDHDHTEVDTLNSSNSVGQSRGVWGIFGNTTRRRRKGSHFSDDGSQLNSPMSNDTGSVYSDEHFSDSVTERKIKRRSMSMLFHPRRLKDVFSNDIRVSKQYTGLSGGGGKSRRVNFSTFVCSIFRLSVLMFILLFLLASFMGNFSSRGSGTVFTGFQARFGRNKDVINIWEDYDPRWRKADMLSGKELRDILPTFEFESLIANNSNAMADLAKSGKDLKDPFAKIYKKMRDDVYGKNAKAIFSPLRSYSSMKSTDLIQIKRPAVRTKRADEPRATRTFGCVRDGCRGLAIEDLLDRGWQMRFRAAENNDTFKDINYRVTFLLTDTTHLTVMQKKRPDLFKKIYKDYEGKCFLSAFDGGDAIGGNKGQQIAVKEKYVRQYGCKFNDLNIAPKSYRLYKKDECEDLMAKTADKELTWILKPETGSQGSGITFHNEVSSIVSKVPQFFPCKGFRKDHKLKATERYLVQQYLSKPLLLKKSKFDVRVYMLVASSNPWLVFYHEGYLRRSLADYSPDSKDRKVYLTNTHFQSMKKGFKLSDHIWPFFMMQDHLSSHGKTGSHYVETILNPYIKKVSNFIFQSAREKFIQRKGTWHVFGIDFMIDANYHVWFIEANGYPGFTWSLNFDTRSMVEEMFNLVQQVHENPRFYQMMQPGDRFGGFEMIFSELDEERIRRQSHSGSGINVRGLYNPCLEFKHNLGLSKPLRKANLLLAKFSGKEGRTDKIKDFNHLIPNKVGSKLSSSHLRDKVWILQSEEKHLAKFGCKRSKLRYTPLTFLLEDEQQCNEFFKEVAAMQEAEEAGNEIPSISSATHKWSVKSPQGIQIYSTKEELFPVYGACNVNTNKGVIAQKLLENRALFENKWWDMKVFFLISSTDPFLVWYHRGYLRTSKIHLNKALKESADLMLQQSRKKLEEDKKRDKKAAEDSAETDELSLEENPNYGFTTEELLEDLEDELGFEISKITQRKFGKDLYDSVNHDNEAGDGGGLSIAGLKNVQVAINKNLDGNALSALDFSDPALAAVQPEEKWAPDEFATGSVWSVGEEFWTFEDFQDKMAKEMLLGSRYLDSIFDSYVRRVINMIFRSIKDQKNRTTNAYELYEADFFLDEDLVIHFLDAKVVDPENAFPNVDDDQLMEEKATFLKHMAELVLETTAAPAAFARMIKGDSFGDWRLVYSELEETQRKDYNKKYNPCEEFKKNLMVHKGSIYKNGWLHNYGEKRHAANKRELNKYIQNKWTTCKYKSSRELMSSCIRNTISYRYKIYIQKEGIEYQEGYVENRIRDLIAKREAERNGG